MLPLNAIFWGFILLFNIPIKVLDKFNIVTTFIGYVMIIYGCYNLKDKNKYFKNGMISYITVLGLNIITLFFSSKASIPKRIESTEEIISMLKTSGPYMIIEIILSLTILMGIYSICMGIAKIYEEKDKNHWNLKVIEVWRKFRNSVIATLSLTIILFICALIAFYISTSGLSIGLYFFFMLFILISVIVLLINYIRIIIQLRYAHGILEKDMEVVDQYGKKY
ncbi:MULTISPECIES: hypothetical protein [Clostridium]|uniref:DUF443 family protein n=1 Tax=Clostridium faecium TaxID=2762223 RepID=A0ABR8YUA0_9CLOT|nr:MULTISPECIES: hypothetical protein [Clostridium]MBD8047842.1 hypothetical protein [Clostridium faecium]MDU1349743.1 hypothetical protein [Clostridium argentinense]